MDLKSSSFNDGEGIPDQYIMEAIGDRNISFSFAWGKRFGGGKVLSLIDPHPVANNWIRWLVINIPPKIKQIAEGASGKNMPDESTDFVSWLNP